MKAELKHLVKDLKKFLASSDEDDLTLKAAPGAKSAVKQKAAFKVSYTTPKTPEVAFASAEADSLKTKDLITEPQMPAKTASSPKTNNKQQILDDLVSQIENCKRCDLGATRIKAVPGEGNINAKLMFIGEGPGFDEDRQGRPFVGRAGQLLDKIIAAMGFEREQVFIANIVKCHPMVDPSTPDKHGNDRAPKPEEIAVCRKYIEAQIAAVAPTHIVALGGVAAKSLIKDSPSLAAIRGKIYDLQITHAELQKPVKILATFHPAALLRNPNWKKDAWADLKILMNDMGINPPAQEIPGKKKAD